ncbi:hypothetical protein CALVIDRAFT_225402 [Calocera viscosa TUFC12733]|uniref:Uncharacterized protein n=1 Tax=Calocera viscosa (strain TUFC12733) TaxID=1330018 RepID=A0A167K0S2_CALVF|nr:hypothetical protein CALVIDRAFT_225402 [Calocera viscosa TUFC12733]
MKITTLVTFACLFPKAPAAQATKRIPRQQNDSCVRNEDAIKNRTVPVRSHISSVGTTSSTDPAAVPTESRNLKLLKELFS